MLLVTGCCGFVGARLTQRLLANGHSVVGVDNLYRPGSIQNLWALNSNLPDSARFHFMCGDVSEIDLAFINSDIQAVFHLAGQVAMTKSIENPAYDFKANAFSTVRLLDAIRRQAKDAAFVYASSNKVYGDLEWIDYSEDLNRYCCESYPNGFDEALPLDFSSPYGCSKGAADQYVKDFAKIYGLRTFCFRHSTIYGNGQKSSYDQGWVGWFLSQVALATQEISHKFTISGNGKQVRDILHVDDVCRLYEAVAFGDYSSCVANIGGGQSNSLSILELLNYASGLYGLKLSMLNISYLAPRAADQRVFISSNTISEKINWSPSIGCHDGIKSILDDLIGKKS